MVAAPRCRGKAHVFGDDIPGDGGIVPFVRDFDLAHAEPDELRKLCLRAIDPQFPERVAPGDFVVAGKNFATGWFHEHSVLALRACGVTGVIAESMRDLFARLLFEHGMLALTVPGVRSACRPGDLLEYDAGNGRLVNLSTRQTVATVVLPRMLGELLSLGSMEDYVKQRIQGGSGAG